jgi:hypothetical protein
MGSTLTKTTLVKLYRRYVRGGVSMQTRSEHGTAPNGARVEVGIVEHEGREYSALGSVVDPERGIVVGYVGKITPAGYGAHVRALTTWDGKTIGAVWPVSSWPTPRSHVSSRMYAYRAEVEGVMYQGRGAGEGMIVKLRKMRGRGR